MLEYDEKRNYIRMDVDCDISYKLADSGTRKTGRCISLSGAGIAFIADTPIEPGLAMEVCVQPKSAVTPPMTAFIEVVRCNKSEDQQFEIAASIKSIKGN